MSATLREVLAALGGHLADVVVAPRGLAIPVRDVVIADPYDDPVLRPGDLVLVVGARGAAARSAVTLAGSRGAAAVAVKPDAITESAVALRDAARDAGVALLEVAADGRWDQLQTLLRSALRGAVVLDTDTDTLADTGGDLFSLAQTIATLTGGSVSIEDPASRVLAYSAVAGEVDDLRLRSILGRRGPESYLTLLREWGVYDALRRPDHVVTVPDHPELGIRRRLAIGVHAGNRALGAIWVQEGGKPLAATSDQVLVGAARLAALDLVARGHDGVTRRPQRSRLLADGLTGRLPGAAIAADLGLPAGPALLVAVSTGAPPEDPSAAALRGARIAEMLAVHAAAFRHTALSGQVGGRVYALLPGLRLGPATGQVQAWASDLLSAVRRETGVPAQAAVVAASLAPDSSLESARAEADEILRALRRTPDRPVATLADVRAAVLMQQALDATRHLHHPGLEALSADLTATLLSYLDAFGDVAVVAARLHVHPNTVRYRVRRACELAELDLDDPEQRLLAALVLRRS